MNKSDMSNCGCDKYTVRAFCGNCHWVGYLEAKKGLPINKQTCPYCGCVDKLYYPTLKLFRLAMELKQNEE